MLKRFIADIQSQYPQVNTSTPGLLAVSGGVDSMVLSLLMRQAGFPFAIAHCNFHLRPGDCDRDEQFVRQWADQCGVPCHVAQFDTLTYASLHHLSVEEAARNLRYAFFEEVRSSHNYAYIATAHHFNDAEETFFINLLRGTGLAGLRGIPSVNGNIIRPLLRFSREEISAYALQQGLEHVEDSTNAELTFLRNQVRHRLLPLLREMNPAVDGVLRQNMEHLSDAYQIFASVVEQARQRLMTEEQGRVSLSISDLLQLSPLRTWLFELLRPYGFSASVVNNLEVHLQGQSGKRFFSPTHQLLKDRDSLIITPLSNAVAEEAEPTLRIEEIPLSEALAEKSALGLSHIVVDADRLTLPLHLRHWREGDRFYPFGMEHSQLMSDYFSDHKFSCIAKEQVWLLEDADSRIVWLVGHRADNRFRLTPSTSQLLKITLCS